MEREAGFWDLGKSPLQQQLLLYKVVNGDGEGRGTDFSGLFLKNHIIHAKGFGLLSMCA